MNIILKPLVVHYVIIVMMVMFEHKHQTYVYDVCKL